jgi:hypothetical protein
MLSEVTACIAYNYETLAIVWRDVFPSPATTPLTVLLLLLSYLDCTPFMKCGWSRS